MILIRSGMPAGTIGFEAIGELTADDYRDVIGPALERAGDQPLRMLVLLDDRFEKLTPGAAVRDIQLWIEHRGDWVRIAVVTDHEWICRAADELSPLVGDRMRCFAVSELDDAQTWVAAA